MITTTPPPPVDVAEDAAPPAPAKRPRRRVRRRTPGELVLLGACAASSYLGTWLVFARLTDGVGWLAFGLCWYLGFLALVYVCSREMDGPMVASDRLVETAMATTTLVLMVPFTLLTGYIISKGLPALRAGFFTHDQAGVRATDPATAGGGAHAIVGSLEQVLLALALTLPLSLLTAAFLNETRSRFRRPVRILVDAMSGLPSIIAGLFIYAFFVIPYADTTTLFNFNGFLACLALSITMLPTITRTVEVVLRLVPDGLREASLALGSSRPRMVWSVVLPSARSGVTTAVVLGIARAVGETAPLLFTSFGLDLMNANPFSDPQESLPIFIFRNVQKPSEAAISRAFTGALVLLIVIVALFAIARFVGRDRVALRARRQRRRRPTEPNLETS